MTPRQLIRDGLAWLTFALKDHLSAPAVGVGFALFCLVWLVAARGLRGWVVIGWIFVPLLVSAAALAVAGPGRLFRKHGHEGRALLELTPDNAITTLDLAGLVCLGAALVIGFVLVRHRLRYSH